MKDRDLETLFSCLKSCMRKGSIYVSFFVIKKINNATWGSVVCFVNDVHQNSFQSIKNSGSCRPRQLHAAFHSCKWIALPEFVEQSQMLSSEDTQIKSLQQSLGMKLIGGSSNSGIVNLCDRAVRVPLGLWVYGRGWDGWISIWD